MGLDHVGIVLGIEMSRLARSGREWHQLPGLCALSGALLGDLDGVAVEAVRRRLTAPERIRTIGVAVKVAAGAELPARMPGARDRARRVLGLPPGATVIGAVGRLTYQKAPEDFLSMIGHLDRPGSVGVWVGGGELAGHIGRLATKRPAGQIILAGEREMFRRYCRPWTCSCRRAAMKGRPRRW